MFQSAAMMAEQIALTLNKLELIRMNRIQISKQDGLCFKDLLEQNRIQVNQENTEKAALELTWGQFHGSICKGKLLYTFDTKLKGCLLYLFCRAVALRCSMAQTEGQL